MIKIITPKHLSNGFMIEAIEEGVNDKSLLKEYSFKRVHNEHIYLFRIDFGLCRYIILTFNEKELTYEFHVMGVDFEFDRAHNKLMSELTTRTIDANKKALHDDT